MKSTEEDRNLDEDSVWCRVREYLSSSSESTHSVYQNNPGSLSNYFHNFPHFRQRESWDCGITCLLMFFSFLREFSQENTENINALYNDILEKCKTHSVWTIDLLFVLFEYNSETKMRNAMEEDPSIGDLRSSTKQRKSSFSKGSEFKLKEKFNAIMVTTALGVEPSYSQLSFYADSLDNDTKRVKERFQCLNDTHIIKGSLNIAHLKRLLNSQRILLLILVDQRYLRIDNNGRSRTKGTSDQINKSDTFSAQEDNHVVTIKDPTGYLGHYIIIHRYDEESDLFYYKDPNVLQPCSRISADRLEVARKAFGTDEDIIIIDLSNSI